MMTEKDRTIVVQVAIKEAGDDLRSDPEYIAGLMAGGDTTLQWRAVAEAHIDWWIDVAMKRCEAVASFGDTAAASQALQNQMGAVPVGGMAPPPQQTYAQPPQMPQQQPQMPQQGYAPPPQQYAPQQGFQPPQQGYAPQPPQGGMQPSQQWEDLVANPANWVDKRANKGPSGNGPDFEHAFMNGSNGKKMALWLNGKFNQPPQHIRQALQMQGRA